MRDLGAQSVSIGETQVFFAKEPTAQLGPSIPDGYRASGKVDTFYDPTAATVTAIDPPPSLYEEEEEEPPAAVLDESDKAELAKRAGEGKSVDTLEWFQERPVPAAE